MIIEPARLSLDSSGTPVSETYCDIYHSAAGGHAQARHVFLAGNDLPLRWQNRPRFSIMETGFGLGLNFLATWSAWLNDARRCDSLHFTSLEKHPFRAEDLAIAHQAWPEFRELSEALRLRWPPLEPGVHRLELAEGQIVLNLVFGDALETLPELERDTAYPVDAFYLDGFSPARNPELWSPRLFGLLARFATEGSTLATWTVAGSVCRALRGTQFNLIKRPGFGSKRQMLIGRFAPCLCDDSSLIERGDSELPV